MSIHPTAIISPRAHVERGVRVGPYAVIEEEVVIKAGCEIGAHVVVKKFTSLGRRNRVYEHEVRGRGERAGRRR